MLRWTCWRRSRRRQQSVLSMENVTLTAHVASASARFDGRASAVWAWCHWCCRNVAGSCVNRRCCKTPRFDAGNLSAWIAAPTANWVLASSAIQRREREGRGGFHDDITRRDALAMGVSAAALAATGASAQTASTSRPPTSPRRRCRSKGASLRMLRPVRFVKADEACSAPVAKFTEKAGVESGRSSAGKTSTSRPRSRRTPAPAPISS